ncbi:MAG: TetR/AcrR family transcriptional regulator [Oscillospiraceae bacterium]|jgi:AcrR family transcriptional regulator|nr:TetR/AcrR family transcriptional regulator [Oscillospiraceae bacterium]
MSSVRESRRSDIIQAALAEFCTKGIEAVSMSEIARRAQIGKSTIYEYFPSKDQLLLETAQMVLDRLLEELEHVFSQKQTFREKLICYYLALERLVERIGVNFPMFFVGEPITGVMLECVDTFRKALFRRLGQEFRLAQARGELNASLDAEVAATLLTTQMTPLLLKAMGRFEVEDAAGKIVDILMNGLAAKPAPAGAETAASQKQRKKD